MPPVSLSLAMKPCSASLVEEGAVLDGEVDLAEIHRHDAPGADIGVADFRIAHLPGRQADIVSEGDQRGGRTARHQPVIGRRIGQHRRIAFDFRRLWCRCPSHQGCTERQVWECSWGGLLGCRLPSAVSARMERKQRRRPGNPRFRAAHGWGRGGGGYAALNIVPRAAPDPGWAHRSAGGEHCTRKH